jgi:hypothetical protein
MAAALRNFTGRNAERSRVFASEVRASFRPIPRIFPV